MPNTATKMKKAIAQARKKAGEPKTPKPRCCNSGWADVHTAKCHKNKGKK